MSHYVYQRAVVTGRNQTLVLEAPCPEGVTVLVPGKLLGSGEVSAKHDVAAYSVSAGAREKIEAAGGRILSLAELMNENPNGSGVYILG